jgi:MFS family permease
MTTSVSTDVPARMDRLPWARWHWMVLVGLGTVWILDGLEVTIVGALGSRLTDPNGGLHLSDSGVGLAASIYIVGAVVGSLGLGYATDRLGRKKLFLVTLLIYLVATVLTAVSFNPVWFFVMRFFAGFGIGGEYAAINSAVDELIPARLRGTVDLAVNGSYWLGAMAGAALTIPLLNTSLFSANLGWRLAFALGALLGVGILLVRRKVPESPRWLFTHGRADEADRLVSDIERTVTEQTGEQLDDVHDSIRVRQRGKIGFGVVARTLLRDYPRRSVLGLGLFVGQAFLYNAVYFTEALVLSTFFHVSDASAGIYLIPLAAGSLLGPLVLGRLFDTVGRRPMIAISYLGSAALLVVTGILFGSGSLSATTLTIAWTVVFFLASAGSSAAYLTVSEVFPLEIRALCIALFYAVGTGLGGIIGPLLFGSLVGTGHLGAVAVGYYIGAAVMAVGGVLELMIGVEAEGKSLEDLAAPLSTDDGGGDDDKVGSAAIRSQ